MLYGEKLIVDMTRYFHVFTYVFTFLVIFLSCVFVWFCLFIISVSFFFIFPKM